MDIATAVGIITGAIVGIGGAMVVARRAGRGLWRGVKTMITAYRQFRQFLADWFGDEEQPGVPARLESIETRLGYLESEWRSSNGNGKGPRSRQEAL